MNTGVGVETPSEGDEKVPASDVLNVKSHHSNMTQ